MNQVLILGAGYAVPHEDLDNTHLALITDCGTILIDCSSNPIVRLRKAHIDFDSVTDLILTHFHPDHVGGMPLLLMSMWLEGRTKPITIHGLIDTLDRAEAMLNLYNWHSWQKLFPVHFHPVKDNPAQLLLQNDCIRLQSSPVKHTIPNIATRMDFLGPQKSVVYSSDTEPCQAVADLAKDADVLIHEVAGKNVGHSAPDQAGAIATRAGVQKLYLIHYPSNCDRESWLRGAQSTFDGTVAFAQDFMPINWD